ncbi:MAG: glutamine-hydrolyzing carbamoyl-phosphate synthase small subunit [Dehalococcoidia bacterium]|jgi:carbamoyl-phosphate synthase small subunit|nr:carbamoyl phosphate synthase small subunit [Chloroflexota bacterium]MDP7486261.1 glutamine-hydrolyzing carbamoyl-phosphate synthase small subunit [Dehalococcoidia bacterium]|tara:strand:+ start:4045 stop:5271 length:1227 start_codon:yes stop_codon:yes gene_type:complete
MSDIRGNVYLVLEDGSVFPGQRFGAEGEITGEVVFNTSMTGYQEMLTDPSYGGQILVLTYPMIGNYGTSEADVESTRIQVNGFVVREDCDEPSHPLSEGTVHDYLLANGIPGISGVDTRAITRKLRSAGVMMGIITPKEDVEAALATLAKAPRYGEFDVVGDVSTDDIYAWNGDAGERSRAFFDLRDRARQGGMGIDVERGIGSRDFGDNYMKVVVNDYGVKLNILRSLRARGCEVIVVPDDTVAEDILDHNPDGVMLSPGPGDPELLDRSVATAKGLAGKVPIMGICLGHQVVARAFGASTFKLHFGHRGGNQPVKDLESGRVYVTAQNHGYAVDPAGLPDGLEVSHINLNDHTVEGLRHRDMPIMTIQYHSEASPGPHDSEYLFDRFVGLIQAGMGAVSESSGVIG